MADTYRNHQVRRSRRILLLILLFLALAVSAGVSLHFTEGWTALESAYTVVITLSTVGFGTPTKLSPAGMGIMIALIAVGVTLAVYLSGLAVQGLLEGELGKILGRIKMERQVQSMKDHYLVCGAGRIGLLVCQELAGAGEPFVVVDRDEGALQKAAAQGYICVVGDATEEETLKAAGIQRAKGLLAVLGSDAENVFLTMTARFLNRDLSIVARASAEKAQKKLYRAGANRCITPESLGGRHMARAILKPTVLEFLDLAMGGGDMNLALDEVPIPPSSLLAGKSLLDSPVRKDYGLIVVAILRPDGTMQFNPSGETRIDEGDVLLALGEKPRIRALKEALGVVKGEAV